MVRFHMEQYWQKDRSLFHGHEKLSSSWGTASFFDKITQKLELMAIRWKLISMKYLGQDKMTHLFVNIIFMISGHIYLNLLNLNVAIIDALYFAQ